MAESKEELKSLLMKLKEKPNGFLNIPLIKLKEMHILKEFHQQ